jgi:uncharacterized LabA/DUF88 family protein
MLERSRKVVLLIDYDNLQICASRDTPGRDLQLTPVVQLAQRYGTVILARAYAEWNLSTERLAVYKAGIEPAFAPVLRTESDRSGKSLADTVMVAEGMDMLWTLSPEVVVLATSDKDLIPLVRVAKQRGAFVVVLGSDFTAIPLREMADEHITYKQLITDAAGRYTTEAGPARPAAALPEPTRRRTRERNGREPRTTATPATPATRTDQPAARTDQPPPARGDQPPAVPTPTATTSAPPEPVAPVGTTTAADVDGQPGSRRRRRRGSRRRSERLGQPADAGLPGDQADEDSAAEAEAEEEQAPLELDATPPEPATSTPSEPTVSTPPEPESAPAEAPAPRERRPRRTRRTSTSTPPTAPAADDADVTPAPEAVSANDMTSAQEGGTLESAAPEAAPEPEAAEESPNGAPKAPARRPRRVASASRGRTRPQAR